MLPPDPPRKEGERGTGSTRETVGGGGTERYSAIKDMPSESPSEEGGKEEARRSSPAERMWSRRQSTSTMVDVILPARR